MSCLHCNQSNRAMLRDWDAICVNCGNLNWLAVGQVVEATIDRYVDSDDKVFGLFVQLGDGVEGVIHVCEMDEFDEAEELPRLPQRLPPGVRIQTKVLRIDRQSRKIALSYRRS